MGCRVNRWLPIVALLAACASPADPAATPPPNDFPHPAGYAESGQHGIDALAAPTPCARCHTVASDTAAGPSCQSCHAYPHDPEQYLGVNHGASWAADPAECVSCHGTDGARSPAGVLQGTCTACHSSYPHGADLLSVHGAAVVAHGGPEACVTCHSEGQGKPRTCTECHDGYPHPSGWAASASHGAAANATCTESCHAADGTGGPSCTSCHDLYPHGEGWSRAHLVPVQARGETTCQGCHPAGSLPGPDMPVSCGASCHGSSP